MTRSFRCLTLVLALIWLVGCTHTLPLKYSPVTAVESLSPEASKKQVVVVHFKDAREKPLIAKVGGHTINTTDDVGLHVSGAVVDALRKGGVQSSLRSDLESDTVTADSVPANADAILVGKVTQFSADLSVGWSNVKCKGLVAIQYRLVTRGSTSTDAWGPEVRGESLTEVPIVMWSDVTNFTDSALQQCMRNLVKDMAARRVLD